MKQFLLYILLLAGCVTTPLAASELSTIKNTTLIEVDMNDGDSFMVNAEGRELYLRTLLSQENRVDVI